MIGVGYKFTSSVASQIFTRLPGGLDSDPWAVNELETATSIREVDGMPLTSLMVDSDTVPKDNGTKVSGVTWRWGWAQLQQLETQVKSQLDDYSTSLAKGGPTEAAARALFSSISQLHDVTSGIVANAGQTNLTEAKSLQTDVQTWMGKYWKYAQAGAVIVEASKAGGSPGVGLTAADILGRASTSSGGSVSSSSGTAPQLSSSSSSSSSGTTEETTGGVEETDPFEGSEKGTEGGRR